MSIKDWKKDDHGLVEVKPGTGFRLALAPGGALLRIQYGEDGGEKGIWREEALQVHLSSIQLRELAAALVATAELVEKSAPKSAQ
jgi:hypothetical protein